MTQFVSGQHYVVERIIARDEPGLIFNIRSCTRCPIHKAFTLDITELKELLDIHSHNEPDLDGFYRINYFGDIILFTKRNFTDIQNQLCVYSAAYSIDNSFAVYCKTAFK